MLYGQEMAVVTEKCYHSSSAYVPFIN